MTAYKYAGLWYLVTEHLITESFIPDLFSHLMVYNTQCEWNLNRDAMVEVDTAVRMT